MKRLMIVFAALACGCAVGSNRIFIDGGFGGNR